MPAAKLDLVPNDAGIPFIEQGATFTLPFNYLDSNDVPVDLTDYTARMQIREVIDDPLPAIDLTTENGGIAITDVVAGEIVVTITAAQTAAFGFIKGVYDLEVVAPSGLVSRLLEGKIKISPEVTR